VLNLKYNNTTRDQIYNNGLKESGLKPTASFALLKRWAFEFLNRNFFDHITAMMRKII